MGLGPPICTPCWKNEGIVARIFEQTTDKTKFCLRCKTIRKPGDSYFGIWQIKPGVHPTYHAAQNDYAPLKTNEDEYMDIAETVIPKVYKSTKEP